MLKEERALVKKIEAKFPRDKAKKGETKIEINGQALGLGRDAREHLDYILGKVAKLVGKGGSFRVEKVARAGGAGKLAGLSDEECDYIWDTDLWFVIPKTMKDPTEEYGPSYTIYFKEKK